MFLYLKIKDPVHSKNLIQLQRTSSNSKIKFSHVNRFQSKKICFFNFFEWIKISESEVDADKQYTMTFTPICLGHY